MQIFGETTNAKSLAEAFWGTSKEAKMTQAKWLEKSVIDAKVWGDRD